MKKLIINNLLAALVGLGAGLVSAFFGAFIEAADKLRNSLISLNSYLPKCLFQAMADLAPVLLDTETVCAKLAPPLSERSLQQCHIYLNHLLSPV
ncbi:hypothetical protein [Desulfocicer niacini]